MNIKSNIDANISNRLVWIDLEMTGLDPDKDRIIEIATVVTDSELEVIEIGPVMAVSQEDALLDSMDDWNTKHHGDSGLTQRVRLSELGEAEVQRRTIKFLSAHVQKGASPLCGNSIWQDRRFLARYMPDLESYFHYRNIDVSSLKELAKRWYPSLQKFEKKKSHEALDDILESIEELKYYRTNLFRASEMEK